jgi:CDP-diacylglycerol--glycerol-3-phosphate 3-phosphatidyltransferase
VGIATRAVRVVILSIGLVFARGASLGTSSSWPAIYVLAVLHSVTTVQRIWHVRGEMKAVELPRRQGGYVTGTPARDR